MNSSLLRSDRATHLKIGMTAALATTLVIVIGICAQPPGSCARAGCPAAAGPTMVAKVDRGLAATR